MNHRLFALLSAALIPLFIVAAPARSAASKPPALTNAQQVLRWSGAARFGAEDALVTPGMCTAPAANCQRFDFTLALPAGTLKGPTDGLFVALRWATNYQQWNLWVYGPDHLLAGASSGSDSDAQTVFIAQPRNGRYRVIASPFSSEPSKFEGAVRVIVRRGPGAAPGTPQAPKLWTTPPRDFHLACTEKSATSTPTNGECTDVPPIVSHPTGWRFGGAFGNSCYTDETTRPIGAPRRCLRFTNTIRNAGDGPMILRADMVAGAQRRTCRMHQVVERVRQEPLLRDAGGCEFHKQHGHFHYLNTSQYSLVPAPSDGGMPNLSARPVASNRKLGYCLVDIDMWADFTDPSRLSVRRWSFPTCNLPDHAATSEEHHLTQEMGISTGWGDIYNWDLPGQYLDITGVADGTYDVISTANPDCTLVESAEGLETAATRIRLTGEKVTVIATFSGLPVPGCVVPTA